MPKTTKRSEARRAAKIARAHATSPKVQEKDTDEQRRMPGNKPPARGIARYPWASVLLGLLVIVCVVLLLYTNHLGPFAKHTTTAKPKTTPTPAVTATPASTPAVTPTPAAQGSINSNTSSPCLNSNVLTAITKTGPGPSASDIAKINHTYSQAQNVTVGSKVYCAGINTNRGLIVAELDPNLAPKTVNNFVFLAQNHFYDGLTFHRVISGFMAQGGDPTGTGSGGPGYSFADEPVKGDYTAGAIAMANSGPNTNGSQFFIVTADQTGKLPKSYNLFGHVVKGLDVAQKLTPTENGSAKPDVMNSVIIQAI
jgi:cyclophilin family peptidyl-prolyl cis-trans isomerase